MTTHQKLAEYQARLERWRGYCFIHPEDLSHRNPSKPVPKDFGLTSDQELFMAQKIHDEVTTRS